MFQAKVFHFDEIKTPQTEENLLYKMARRFYLFSGQNSKFQRLFSAKIPFLTPNSESAKNFGLEMYKIMFFLSLKPKSW